MVGDPAMTDFRASGTIMGPAGLTAVFGMGTGGAPQVSSPEGGPGAVRPRGRGCSGSIRVLVSRRLAGSDSRASGINLGRRLDHDHAFILMDAGRSFFER